MSVILATQKTKAAPAPTPKRRPSTPRCPACRAELAIFVDGGMECFACGRFTAHAELDRQVAADEGEDAGGGE